MGERWREREETVGERWRQREKRVAEWKEGEDGILREGCSVRLARRKISVIAVFFSLTKHSGLSTSVNKSVSRKRTYWPLVDVFHFNGEHLGDTARCARVKVSCFNRHIIT